MDPYIKKLISLHKSAIHNITEVEEAIKDYPINNEKDKANFGNLCILLKGFRLVEEASECLLINDNCVVGEDGNYFIKVEESSDNPKEKADSGQKCKSDV